MSVNLYFVVANLSNSNEKLFMNHLMKANRYKISPFAESMIT